MLRGVSCRLLVAGGSGFQPRKKSQQGDAQYFYLDTFTSNSTYNTQQATYNCSFHILTYDKISFSLACTRLSS